MFYETSLCTFAFINVSLNIINDEIVEIMFMVACKQAFMTHSVEIIIFLCFLVFH